MLAALTILFLLKLGGLTKQYLGVYRSLILLWDVLIPELVSCNFKTTLITLSCLQEYLLLISVVFFYFSIFSLYNCSHSPASLTYRLILHLSHVAGVQNSFFLLFVATSKLSKIYLHCNINFVYKELMYFFHK